MGLIVPIFGLVYLAMAIGQLPGLKVDRTGAAVIGAMALIAFSEITPEAAWAAIDYRTIGLLFGLMVISTAFVVAGFCDRVARLIGETKVGPARLLAIMVAVAGGLSAVLTNDVVVVAMTPILVSITVAKRLNPAPFLLGFCFAANVGSAATIIGSPQNMIAAETLRLSFTGFMRVSALPALLGLPVVWAVVALLYRNRWRLAAAPMDTGGGATSGTAAAAPEPLPFSLLETVKATVVTIAVVAAFLFSDWPHVVIAMGGASLLLLNRRIASKDMLGRVDGDLLLLLMGLFVVNAALASTGLPQRLLSELAGIGLDLRDPLSMLVIMSVPATSSATIPP